MKKENLIMKRITICLALVLLLTVFSIYRSFAQANFGVFATNQGIGASVGIVNGNIALNAAIKTPLFDTQVPTIINLALGYQQNITNNETDNLSITPFFGVGSYRRKDFTAYNQDPTGKAAIIYIREFKPSFSLELGKDWFMGRVYLTANYCGGFYGGIGIKVFANRN